MTLVGLNVERRSVLAKRTHGLRERLEGRTGGKLGQVLHELAGIILVPLGKGSDRGNARL